MIDTGGTILSQASAGYTVTSTADGFAETAGPLVERGDRLRP